MGDNDIELTEQPLLPQATVCEVMAERYIENSNNTTSNSRNSPTFIDVEVNSVPSTISQHTDRVQTYPVEACHREKPIYCAVWSHNTGNK